MAAQGSGPGPVSPTSCSIHCSIHSRDIRAVEPWACSTLSVYGVSTGSTGTLFLTLELCMEVENPARPAILIEGTTMPLDKSGFRHAVQGIACSGSEYPHVSWGLLSIPRQFQYRCILPSWGCCRKDLFGAHLRQGYPMSQFESSSGVVNSHPIVQGLHPTDSCRDKS
jgi:hypothetical protein